MYLLVLYVSSTNKIYLEVWYQIIQDDQQTYLFNRKILFGGDWLMDPGR